MERLADLISKLKEQFEQNADPSQLLIIAQSIEAELANRLAPSRPALGSSKVSVVMPAGRNVQNTYVQPLPEQKEVEIPVKQSEKNIPAKKQDNNSWLFDPMTEIPTLAHQRGKELNESIGLNESSLNDKLKESVVEIGHKLTDSPIRDLKKAIGVNDRYLFINELFRGDDVMYERSLKTINSFRMFPEAEYWIERELKVKLGWEEHKTTTKHFYQLVKRRFS
ncbi:MAG: hypothetical protein H7122_20400 [Chitinophagaceae bacterium]|nr:hypothetical protein [Chitinophagaceae bacterium]